MLYIWISYLPWGGRSDHIARLWNAKQVQRPHNKPSDETNCHIEDRNTEQREMGNATLICLPFMVSCEWSTVLCGEGTDTDRENKQEDFRSLSIFEA